MILPALLIAGLALLPQSRGRWIERSYGDEPERLRYRLYLPDRPDGSGPPALVVMLHGCTQSAEDFAAGTRMHELAESEGFLLVLPEQRPDAHPQRCWNWYDPAHQRRDAGEPALIAGIAREVLAEHGADPDRVYVGGISAGGAMSLNVAAAYPDLFAAVGVHSGVGYAAAQDVEEALRVMREGPPEPAFRAEALRAAMGERARVLPLLAIHGSEDAVVDPVNSDALAAQWTLVMGWIRGGGPPPRLHQRRGEEGGRAFSQAVLSDPEGEGSIVEKWRVEGLGHAWSGGSPGGSYTDPAGPDASREMVRFFLRHPRSLRLRSGSEA